MTTKSQNKQTECNCTAKSKASEIKGSNGRPLATAKSSADNRISLLVAGKDEPLGQVNHISWLCLKRLLKRSRDFISPSYAMKGCITYPLLLYCFCQVMAIFTWSAGNGISHSHLACPNHLTYALKPNIQYRYLICLADKELERDREVPWLWRELRVKIAPENCCRIYAAVYDASTCYFAWRTQMGF